MRTKDDVAGKVRLLWPDLDYSVKAYLTNDFVSDEDYIARDYEGRAGVEPAIGELKRDLKIGAVPTALFQANQAMLLIKLLAFNLFRRFSTRLFPSISYWRTDWLRRALILVPARLLRSGRRHYLRIPESTYLDQMPA